MLGLTINSSSGELGNLKERHRSQEDHPSDCLSGQGTQSKSKLEAWETLRPGGAETRLGAWCQGNPEQ